jgi:starch phosphorylase
MWELMKSYLGNDIQSIQRQIVNHVEYTLARTRFDFDNFGAYQAAAYAVRDRLIESWNDTQQYHEHLDSKRVYYFSLEFLMGRTFQNALVNSDLDGPFKDALMDMGYNLEELYEEETDAALGNGGLGRLAACFVDSLATLEIPAWGYGIRYEYGIFKQVIRDGYQVEIPDYWLNHGNPWEVERQDI